METIIMQTGAARIAA